MPKTVFYTATSVDGFIADDANSLDWLFQFGPLEGGDHDREYAEFIAGVGALAMGRTTYEWLLEHEDLLAEPQKWPYTQPTWVFTHRVLPGIPGADLRFVSGDVAPVHAAMTHAAAGGDLWVIGGGDLVGQFHDAGLLDELVLGVMPVVLGAGAPLLPRRIATPPLTLLDVERHGDVSVTLRYAVAHPER